MDFNMYARKVQKSPELCPKDHKGRHPAEVVAEHSFSKQDAGDKDQAHNSVVDDVALDGGDRNAMFRLKEKVYGYDLSAVKIAVNNDGEPDKPYYKFYVISPSLLWVLFIDGKSAFLQASRRAEPAAEQPSERYGEQEHKREEDKATVDDSCQPCIYDQGRAEIVEGDGEQ